MITDNFLLFSTAQAVTVTAPSTNVVDMLNARDPGPGDRLEVYASVTTTFTGGTSLQVQVQESVDNSTWVTLVETHAIPLANLTANALVCILKLGHRPPDIAIPRYLRLNYVVVGTMTAGAIEAGLVLDAGPQMPVYPAGVTITN
jgi:hypothetical protein